MNDQSTTVAFQTYTCLADGEGNQPQLFALIWLNISNGKNILFSQYYFIKMCEKVFILQQHGSPFQMIMLLSDLQNWAEPEES